MLQRFKVEDWDSLVLAWEAECAGFSENFEDYSTASLPVLYDLVKAPPRRDAAVFGVLSDEAPLAVCQANSTLLPGYTGKVLRIRHIVLAPRFDFDNTISTDDYADLLVRVFTGALDLSEGSMKSDHVKFHLRSPAERAFGSSFTKALEGNSSFTQADIKGSWIYLSKT